MELSQLCGTLIFLLGPEILPKVFTNGNVIFFFHLFQILVVIEPLLIDEDYYARVEGREIISNLAKVIHFNSAVGVILYIATQSCL